jgi:hypothetical protein
VALLLARALLGRSLWRPVELLSLAVVPISPLVRADTRTLQHCAPPADAPLTLSRSLARLQRAAVPRALAAAAAPLAAPVLALRLLPALAGAALPRLSRTLRLWTHLLPIYVRYRLAGWRAQRALDAPHRRRRRGAPAAAVAAAAASAEAAPAEGAQPLAPPLPPQQQPAECAAAEAAAAALWDRTHEWGGRAVYDMVLDLSVRAWRAGALSRARAALSR